jgi:putative tricarboxylic transport membrane protein
MKVNDAVIGAAVLLLAVVMMLHVSIGWDWVFHTGFSGFPRAQPGKPGPALFPFTLGILFAVCGLILLLRGRRAAEPWLVVQDWARDRTRLLRWAGVVGSILAYQWLSDVIGFLPLAILLTFLLMLQLRVSWLTALLSAVACALVIHTLFVKVLLVPLPWGLLEPIAW